MKFEGFLKVYMESDDEEQEEQVKDLLPPLRKVTGLPRKITATERFTQHPPRYTEASLVKKLEELGIGRPSTYAPTISTIQNRGYVVKEDRPGHHENTGLLCLMAKTA
jgi:DNA topoisomerase I